jgi:O-antigen/teichoic acid export membrane protein
MSPKIAGKPVSTAEKATDLKTQTFKGTLAMGGATVLLRVISIVTSFLLANLLDPVAFGIVGTAGIVLSTTSLFSGLGLGAAVVQTRAERGKAAYQAFVVTMAIGALLTTIILVLSGFFAHLLDHPEVTPVLQWMSLIIFLSSLTIVPEALLQKDMLFGRISNTVVASELCNIGVSLGLAYLGFGYWSLVWGLLSKSVLTVVLYWWVSPRREWLVPQPWDGPLMKNLLTFGLNTTGGGVITYIYSIIDNLTVVRWLGTNALGLYGKAYDFTSRSVDSINNVLGSVLLPSYARIQGEVDRLARAYLKTARLIAFVTVPVSLGMVITAPEMVSTLLKAEWKPMIPAFQVLACVGLVKPLSASTSALFLSAGRPVYNVRAGLVVLFTMLPLFALLLPFGIVGIAYSVLGAHIVGLAFNVYQMQTVLKGTAVKMILAPGPAIAAGLVMMAAVQACKEPLRLAAGGSHTIMTVIGMIVVGFLSYGAVLYLLQRTLVTEVKGLIHARFVSRS